MLAYADFWGDSENRHKPAQVGLLLNTHLGRAQGPGKQAVSALGLLKELEASQNKEGLSLEKRV